MTHYVDWTLDSTLGVRGKARCNDLDCDGRKICDRSECEEGCVDPDNHPLRRVDYCNFETWLNEDDLIDCYVGLTVPLINHLPITVEWNGNGYNWRYAAGGVS